MPKSDSAPGSNADPDAAERRGAEPAARPERGSQAWLEAEGLGQAGEARGPGVLGPLHVAPDSPGGGIAAEGARPGGRVEPERDPARLQARLDGEFQELLATDRARTLPDAYWSGLREKLETGLHLPWSVLGQGPSDDAVVSRGRVGQALAAWQKEAERWARQGSPAEQDAEGRALEEARGRLAAHDLLGSPGRQTALFVTELVTRVELEQAPDGGVVACRLLATSGNPAHDALVLDHVRVVVAAARDRLGAPPARRRTRWAVRTRFEVVPPYPVVACGFDAQFHLTGCVYPLKRTVHTSVRLEQVWGP